MHLNVNFVIIISIYLQFHASSAVFYVKIILIIVNASNRVKNLLLGFLFDILIKTDSEFTLNFNLLKTQLMLIIYKIRKS
jgi:hypothetical protein